MQARRWQTWSHLNCGTFIATGKLQHCDIWNNINSSISCKAWAHAVKVDGTIIVLHSGNHELICLRHRGSQTLYVSDLIEPSDCTNPGYGKLHVGIYVAGIQDAIDRKKQQPRVQPPPGSLNDGADDSADGDTRKDNQRDDPGRPPKGNHPKGSKGGRGQGGSQSGGGVHGKATTFRNVVAKKNAAVDVSMAVKVGFFEPYGHPDQHRREYIIQIAKNRDVLFLSLQYDMYDSPTPAAFLRSAAAITEDRRNSALLYPRDIANYRAEDCHSVTLVSEIGRGATGVVHRGMLDVESSCGFMTLGVVVKLAFDKEQRVALKNEYEIYRLLRSKRIVNGIATVLGLFDDFEGGPSALVMLDAGESLGPERSLSAAERWVI